MSAPEANLKLFASMFAGRSSATLDEFTARDAYYRERGAAAFAAGIPAADCYKYTWTDETTLMMERGWRDAALKAQKPAA